MLKISSVIGYLFPLRVLRNIFPIELERQRLPKLLDELNGLSFILVEPSETEISYLFKHLTTKEVAYDMLLFAHRRQIHRSIAAWYERTHSANLSTCYPLLAYHWSRAGEEDKAIDALERAGEQALRGGAIGKRCRSCSRRACATTVPARGALARAGRRGAPAGSALGEAYLGLGQLAESRVHTERALRLLEQPVPATLVRLVGLYARQVVRQAAHRLWPSRFAGRSPARRDAQAGVGRQRRARPGLLLLAGRPPGRLLLPALEPGGGGGAVPGAGGSYATMCIASSLIPLHRLAEAYGRRAWAIAEAIDDLATRTFVAELLGVYWLSIGNWKACERSWSRPPKSAGASATGGDGRRVSPSLRASNISRAISRGPGSLRGTLADGRQNGHDQAQVWGRHGQSTILLRMGRIEEAASLLEESPAVRGFRSDRRHNPRARPAGRGPAPPGEAGRGEGGRRRDPAPD